MKRPEFPHDKCGMATFSHCLNFLVDLASAVCDNKIMKEEFIIILATLHALGIMCSPRKSKWLIKDYKHYARAEAKLIANREIIRKAQK